MGLDMSYQAIPADCDLIQRAGPGRPLEGMLSMMVLWFCHGSGPRASWVEGTRFWHEMCELSVRHPGLEKRNFDLSRSWDELHYLLSESRRAGTMFERDGLLDKAVHGGSEEVDEGVRHVTPQEVALIAAVLKPMTIEDLRPHYAPATMEDCGVYKFRADAEKTFEESAAQFFPGFRAFYLDAAEHDEGVLVYRA